MLVFASCVLLTMAACDGDDGSGGPPIPSAGTVTLTEGECIYEGPEAIAAGGLSTSVVNQTDAAATFELLRIDQRSSYEGFASYVRRQEVELESGTDTFQPPPFAEVVSTLRLGRSEGGAFAATVESGSYGFLCSRLAGSDSVVEVFAAGPLEIGASATASTN